jgi:hypothetical protein
MLKRFLTLVCAVAVAGVALAAQQPKPAAKPSPEKAASEAKPEPAPAKSIPEPAALPINVKIEVSITDQTGANPAAKRLVTMIAGDRQPTSIRSGASVPVKLAGSSSYSYRNVTINVDARPAIVAKEPNKIQVSFGLEYVPRPQNGAEEMEPGMAQLNERLSLILESGKPMVVSQAADPMSDRKITVEVTATILK